MPKTANFHKNTTFLSSFYHIGMEIALRDLFFQERHMYK